MMRAENNPFASFWVEARGQRFVDEIRSLLSFYILLSFDQIRVPWYSMRQ